MSCSAVFCASRTTKGGLKDPELSFHTFPKCPEIRREWIKAVRRANWEPSKYSRLCSKHFEKSCYVAGLSIQRLKTDAVPTIFEGYPIYHQPILKKRKLPQRRDEREKLKRMQEDGDNIPTTPMDTLKLLKTLAHSRIVAKRRLCTIKQLREKNRRLEKKNATLVNVINDLKKSNRKRTVLIVV